MLRKKFTKKKIIKIKKVNKKKIRKKIYIKKYKLNKTIKRRRAKIKKSLKKIKINKKRLKNKKISKYKNNPLNKLSLYIKDQFNNFFGLKSYFQSKIISWKENRRKKQLKLTKQQAILKKRELELLKKKKFT